MQMTLTGDMTDPGERKVMMNALDNKDATDQTNRAYVYAQTLIDVEVYLTEELRKQGTSQQRKRALQDALQAIKTSAAMHGITDYDDQPAG